MADRDHLFARMPARPIDVYDLPDADLSELRVIRAFLDAGKVVAFAGQLLRPWLPGLELRPPAGSEPYRHHGVTTVSPHPVSLASTWPTSASAARWAGTGTRGCASRPAPPSSWPPTTASP